MAGYSKQLADWVEEVLSKDNIKSARQAETSVDGVLSYATLQNMRNGKKVSYDSVIKFATAFNTSPNPGLRACGYLGLEDIAEGEQGHKEDGGVDEPPAEELIYEPLSEEEGQVLRFYHGINPILQPKALAILKALMDEDPDYEEGKVYGKKAE